MRRLSMVMAGVALLAAPAAGLIAPAAAAAAAAADPAVVSATIYTGSQAGITSQTVTVGGLTNCPTYSGASPFLLDPSGIPYQPAPGSSWSLDTIVECGLRIPAPSLTDVAVQSLEHGFETPPLSPADLTDPNRYQDPTAAGALPVISRDGEQDQVTYARPERSPGDANAGDSVTATGPVSIAVYEKAAPLHVRASAHRLSASSTALTERFAATVTDAAGHALAAAGLSWSWSFGDGMGSARTTPEHSFPLGHWFVTVVVTDHANGTGGTDTIPVGVDPHALTAPAAQGGAGNNRTGPSPSGAVTGPPARPGRTPHVPTHHRSSPARPRTSAGEQSATPATTPPTTTPPAATAPPATTPAPAATAAPATTTSPALAPYHHPARSRRRRRRRVTRARSAPAGRIVRGLLIADVTPVAPAASRLTQALRAVTSAPAIVRAATHAPAGFSGLIAVGLVGALLALGAAREHRGRRRWRELRRGP